MYARAYVFKENIVKKNKKEKYFIFIILNLMKIKKRTYFKSINRTIITKHLINLKHLD